jgi:hypothetical protein
MKAQQIFNSWLRRHSEPDWGWQDGVRNELAEEQRRGLSRQEMVDHLASQMYADDLHDLGSVADLGFFTWQLYLGAARFVVDSLLPLGEEVDSQQQDTRPDIDRGRRIA